MHEEKTAIPGYTVKGRRRGGKQLKIYTHRNSDVSNILGCHPGVNRYSADAKNEVSLKSKTTSTYAQTRQLYLGITKTKFSTRFGKRKEDGRQLFSCYGV